MLQQQKPTILIKEICFFYLTITKTIYAASIYRNDKQ